MLEQAHEKARLRGAKRKMAQELDAAEVEQERRRGASADGLSPEQLKAALGDD